jgi:hypothetical protein
LGAAGPFEAEPRKDKPDRRNVRAGDDGELAGGSGISQANAAGETDGVSADVGGTLDDARPEGPGRPEGLAAEGAVPSAPGPEGAGPDGLRPEGAGREGAGREGAVADASAPDGFAADPAGSGADVAGADGAPELNADVPAAEGCSPTWLAGFSRSGVVPFDRLRDGPMVSAGSAGTPTAMVASAAAGRAVSFAAPAGLPLGEASLPPLAEASLVTSIPFPAAGAALAERPAPGVPSDSASSGGAALAGADLAAVDVCGDRLGGAMMPSCSSSIRSSPVALDVTTVGEPPPEPSGLSVRLSKPSSL